MEKAPICVRAADGESFPIDKLAWRRDLSSGCIIRRPFFCALPVPRAASLCPVHTFWPLIRRRVEPGAQLFSLAKRRNFNLTSNAVFSEMGIPDAGRYSSHAARWGDTQELTESGPPWSAAASSGLWHSPRFPRLRRYIPRLEIRRSTADQLGRGFGAGR